MSRFIPNRNRPDHLVASIIALAEHSNRLALDTAVEAASADEIDTVVDRLCSLAVGAGVAGGEIAWLVGELETIPCDQTLRDEAGVAVAGMESCMVAVASVISDRVDRRGPVEVAASAEALRRVSGQLAALLGRLQPCG